MPAPAAAFTPPRTPVRAIVALGLVLLLLPMVPATAQQATPPFSCADTVQAALEPFQGQWDVQALFRQGPTAWDTTTARAVIQPELAGCVLREDYQGSRYGEPYRYLAVWGANAWPEARIQRFFVHAGHGILGLAAGSLQGDTLVPEERFTLRGHPIIQQNRYARPSPAGFTQLGRRSEDGGHTWIETLRATFRRSTS